MHKTYSKIYPDIEPKTYLTFFLPIVSRLPNTSWLALPSKRVKIVFITPFLFLFSRLILHSSCGVPWRLKIKVKNLPTMWETWVLPLHWKDPWRRSPLEDPLLTPVFWPGEFHGLYSHGVSKSWTRLSNFHFSLFFIFPGSATGKESTCNAGDPGLIPGSGRSLEKT